MNTIQEVIFYGRLVGVGLAICSFLGIVPLVWTVLVLGLTSGLQAVHTKANGTGLSVAPPKAS